MRYLLLIAALFMTSCGGDFSQKRVVEDPIDDGTMCEECECFEDGSCICTGCEQPDAACCENGCDGDDCALGVCDCPDDCDCGCDGDDAGSDRGDGDGGCSGGSCAPFAAVHCYENFMMDRVRCL